MGAGKGDFPRNISEKFRENHDKFAHLESIQDVLPDDHPLKIKQ